MVRLGKGQVILGGYNNNGYHNKIYRMDCSNRNCSISLLNTERSLSGPSGPSFVAITIPDKISGCPKEGKH